MHILCPILLLRKSFFEMIKQKMVMGTFYNLHFQESAMIFATQSQLRRKEQEKALQKLDDRSNPHCVSHTIPNFVETREVVSSHSFYVVHLTNAYKIPDS